MRLFLIAIPMAAACCLAQDAKQLFIKNCAICHGADAGGSDRGPTLAGNRRLRTRSAADIAQIIRDGTPGGMPGIPLPEDQGNSLAGFVVGLNANALDVKSNGDPAAGERFFLGSGKCNSCHTIAGRGGVTGPDFSNIARQLTLAELEQALTDPSARIAPGYGVV